MGVVDLMCLPLFLLLLVLSHYYHKYFFSFKENEKNKTKGKKIFSEEEMKEIINDFATVLLTHRDSSKDINVEKILVRIVNSSTTNNESDTDEILDDNDDGKTTENMKTQLRLNQKSYAKVAPFQITSSSLTSAGDEKVNVVLDHSLSEDDLLIRNFSFENPQQRQFVENSDPDNFFSDGIIENL
jgi:hypothetical protein